MSSVELSRTKGTAIGRDIETVCFRVKVRVIPVIYLKLLIQEECFEVYRPLFFPGSLISTRVFLGSSMVAGVLQTADQDDLVLAVLNASSSLPG